MKILLLAGTGEARALAKLLADHGQDVLASLAGVTREPMAYPVPTREGGFGGEAAQRAFMIDQDFDAVVDATHPFAVQISNRSHKISVELSKPYLRLLRSEWREEDGDDWYFVDQPGEASTHIPSGARVFLATGAASVADWAELAEGRTLFCRRVDATDDPFPYEGDWIVGRPPFSLEEELDTLRTLGITHLVSKNAGGPTSAKLLAARQLGLPVVMLNRPALPDCDFVETPQEALAWLTRLSH
ncbi:Precorrin-6A reductase [Aliiroseovarius pelagivivens]|uniref:Precorrin-6A reductase n=1 Tax=Aliiroseovarius pelagivivens TaxID=1639690 RepID=A0A2R8AJG3_9RHOB|nr:precorrin-6A/cobalt-precorrin-6A reductase [Aliiroseovarius pelagivivens]SPF76188.1 Precorrin-6A reductase [Aliiroseovarius pelagivivens]